jgi:hypothetical protein
VTKRVQGEVVFVSRRRLRDLEQQYRPGIFRRAKGKAGEVSKVNVGANVGPGGGQLGVEFRDPPPRDDDVQRALELWERMEKAGHVGTVSDPKTFFAGDLEMREGFFRKFDPAIYYLTGLADTALVVLGGRLDNHRTIQNHQAEENAQRVDMEWQVVVGLDDMTQRIYGKEITEQTTGRDPSLPTSYKASDVAPSAFAAYDYYWKDMPAARVEFLAALEHEFPGPAQWPDRSKSDTRGLLVGQLIVATRLGLKANPH